ncbi:MAG: hypothetical protein ACK5CY_09370, partial [Bacteroidia bacterium]
MYSIILSAGCSYAQCELTLDSVTVCNNSPAVLGLGMQFTIAGVPSLGLVTNFSWTGPSIPPALQNQQYPILTSPSSGTYTLT